MENRVSEKKDNILIISPKDYLDNDKAGEYIEKFNKDIAKVDFSKIDAVVVSLSQVSSFNRNGIIHFSKFLLSLKQKYKDDLIVGFIDYDDEQFQSIRQMFEDRAKIGLFKNIETISFFISKNQSKNSKIKILLYLDNKNQENLIYSELLSLGYTVVVAKNDEDFKRYKTEFETENIITQVQLSSLEEKVASRVNEHFVVFYPEGTLDGEFESIFDLKLFRKYISQGFSVFSFDFSEVTFLNNRGANFIIDLQKHSFAKHIKIAIFNIQDGINQNLIQHLAQHGIMIFHSEKDLLNNKNLVAHGKASLDKSSSAAGFQVIKDVLGQIIESINSSFKMMLEMSCIKKELKVLECKNDINPKTVSSKLELSGTIHINMIFVYEIELSKEIAKKMLMVDKVGIVDLIDSTSEITNILGGAIKTILSNSGQNVKLSTPKTERLASKLFENMLGKKAIRVELEVNSFKLFLYIIP